MEDSDGCKFVRSRLVARGGKEKSDCREELFVATPPLEILKAMLTLAHSDGFCAPVQDIKRRISRARRGRRTGATKCRRRRGATARASVGGSRGGFPE